MSYGDDELVRIRLRDMSTRIKDLESELEKLRSDLHLALTMRDQYFIQLGEAQRALKDIHEKAEASRAANGNALAFAVLKLTREVLKNGRET